MKKYGFWIAVFILSYSVSSWAGESSKELLILYSGDTLGHVEPCG
jgi:hypothetical protein